MCSWTNSRTRAARSGSWSRSSCRSWGEGFGAADDALPPSIFIVGDRKQSIYGFRDADVAVLDEAAAVRRRRCGPTAAPRQAISGQLPSGAGDPGVRQRRVRRRSSPASRPQRERRVPVRRERSVSPMPSADRRDRSEPVCEPAPDAVSVSSPARRVATQLPIASPTRSSACCPARPCAIGRPASPRAARPADIAILFRSRDSHREFEKALEAPRRLDLRLQGARILRRRRNPGRRRAAALSGRPAVRICAPPRSCDRGSSGCPTRASRTLAPRLADAILGRLRAGARLWRTKIGASWSACAPRCRAGWRRSIGSRRRSCSTRCSRDGVCLRAARDRGGVRRART